MYMCVCEYVSVHLLYVKRYFTAVYLYITATKGFVCECTCVMYVTEGHGICSFTVVVVVSWSSVCD